MLAMAPCAFFINYIIGYIVGGSAFFWRDEPTYSSFTRTHEAINNVLVGLIIPLDKLTFLPFVVYLPQSWILHHPMQVYLGKYNQSQILQTFLGGFIWCLVLWIAARFMFKFGLKKNEAVGL